MELRIRSDRRDRTPEHFSRVSRRSWLAGVVLGLTAVPAASRSSLSMPSDPTDSDTREIALVQASAKKAGLDPFSQTLTPHFLGLGDADDAFRKKALEICESLAPEFVKHFNDKGFKLALPEHRLTVITLKDDIAYQAFTGDDPGTTHGGLYDLDTNRLVMFDFRPKGNAAAIVGDPRKVNRFALVHETTHLLCYNTGLLSRKSNVPLWVSEGLATYVELWQNKRTKIGEPNSLWLAHLKQTGHTIPIADLVAADEPFLDENTAQLAYAESWLLVYHLMKKPRLEKFQAYLANLPADGTAAERVAYAEKHLGSLKTLNHELGRELKRLSR